MKKAKNIFLIITGIASLLLIAILIFIGTGMGKKADPDNYASKEQYISDNQNPDSEPIKTDSIPQGKITFELYFAEFEGRMENLPVETFITGNKISVHNNEQNPLTGGEIIMEGVLLKHKSGKWIIAEMKTDQNAEEIGGCTGIPIIYFEKRVIEWC